MRAHAALALVATVGAVAAAPARANTLAYGGTTATTDNVNQIVPFDAAGPTNCAASPSEDVGGGPVPYRKYAFRNASASSDCITIGGSTDCAQGETFDVSFDLTDVLGSDHANDPTCQANHAHSFNAAAGQTFAEAVFTTGPNVDYSLTAHGSDVVPVHLLDVADALLPGGDQVTAFVSSLEDGSGIQGTLSVGTGSAHRYGGSPRCLRVSGDTASLVMTFDGTQTGLASKWKGAVFWFRQSQDGTADAQRNSILDQHQLDTTYASCPDPTRPLAPGFRQNISNDSTVLVVANGPQATL
jgi:hypothetical protein